MTLEELKQKVLVEKEPVEKRLEDIYTRWKNQRPFTSYEDIPSFPQYNENVFGEKVTKELHEYVTKRYIELGAIPKNDLVVGHTYEGDCRNAHIAVWKENGRFEYQRTKFGYTYPEEINHFEDDNGYDVFVPIKDITQ